MYVLGIIASCAYVIVISILLGITIYLDNKRCAVRKEQYFTKLEYISYYTAIFIEFMFLIMTIFPSNVINCELVHGIAMFFYEIQVGMVIGVNMKRYLRSWMTEKQMRLLLTGTGIIIIVLAIIAGVYQKIIIRDNFCFTYHRPDVYYTISTINLIISLIVLVIFVEEYKKNNTIPGERIGTAVFIVGLVNLITFAGWNILLTYSNYWDDKIVPWHLYRFHYFYCQVYLFIPRILPIFKKSRNSKKSSKSLSQPRASVSKKNECVSE